MIRPFAYVEMRESLTPEEKAQIKAHIGTLDRAFPGTFRLALQG